MLLHALRRFHRLSSEQAAVAGPAYTSGRLPRPFMKALPVCAWSEPIDGLTVAGVASCHVVRSGWIYGHSVFVIADMSDDELTTRFKFPNIWTLRDMARNRARDKLAQEIATKHYGRLPPIGPLRDVGGEWVDSSW